MVQPDTALKVMVIDDSKTIRRTAEMLLSEAGCEVITAIDGFDALAKIVDHRPGIIFVDVLMPRLDGYQTCALVKHNSAFKDIPVIMLSSRDGLFDKARGRIAGSDQFLTKPFSKEELLEAIRAHVPGFAAEEQHAPGRHGPGRWRLFPFMGNSMARILIVDDSPTETYKFTAILEKHGHQVLKANNGADGVALAVQEKPDAVLMDIVMPGMNGFQATRQLSKDPATKDIPVIIVTTKDQETDKVWGQRQGAKDYLVKPVEEDALIKVLDGVLKG